LYNTDQETIVKIVGTGDGSISVLLDNLITYTTEASGVGFITTYDSTTTVTGVGTVFLQEIVGAKLYDSLGNLLGKVLNV
jgi:hypothetical protein